MATLAQVCAAPRPFDAPRGAEARALFADLPENLQYLIEGVAGCSPYLGQSLARESAWLGAQIDTPLDQIIVQLMQVQVQGDSFQALSDKLRIHKRRLALVVALADLGGLWKLEQVTQALSDFADAAVQAALEHLVGAEIARGKLPGCTMADIPQAAGMVALAMGKMGAGELNYSSDIDLIMLFDQSRHAPENWAVLRSRFIRITQRMVKLLSDNTAQGYVFRTDLRLRPDPSVTPVCIAMEPAERYYESLGRTWERAAFIKARPCAGAIDAGWDFLGRLRPFIWRRHLDFAAIEDAHDMRLRIREHKGLGGAISIPGHNIKLGQGGIREIEFFAQTRQIICGGRDDSLRARQTVRALDALAKKGWISASAADELGAAYTAHRTLEHRIQMIDDAQTHDIPTDLTKRQRLATFCSAPALEPFEADILMRLNRVHHITESFFAPDTPTIAEQPDASGFDRPALVDEMFAKWQTYPALRTTRAQRIFARLTPHILRHLSAAANPDEALIEFDNFLNGLPAGVQVFSLFDANPSLLDLLVDICATAPDLARYLGRNARVLEAVITAGFYDALPGLDVLHAELAALINKTTDYEERLDITRVWAQEIRFRIGVHLLRGISTPQTAALAYSDVAESCIRVLFDAAVEHFSTRYGTPPGKGAAVIAMGKLGSKEMTVSSDLDLIVVYDPGNDLVSSGKRPLAIQPYYARLTQTFISALTVATSRGGLYEVDMRLRPSGRSGPVATSIDSFADYQQNKAWIWEHMALLRARVVAGAGPVARQAEAVITQTLAQKHPAQSVLDAMQDMRVRLMQARATEAQSPFEIKHGPGRLMDVELLLQSGALISGLGARTSQVNMAQALGQQGWLNKAETADVIAALGLYNAVQQVARLAISGALDPSKAGRGAMAVIHRVAGVGDTDALEHLLDETSKKMERLIDNKRGKHSHG